jgi:hypothetical protein
VCFGAVSEEPVDAVEERRDMLTLEPLALTMNVPVWSIHAPLPPSACECDLSESFLNAPRATTFAVKRRMRQA